MNKALGVHVEIWAAAVALIPPQTANIGVLLSLNDLPLRDQGPESASATVPGMPHHLISATATWEGKMARGRCQAAATGGAGSAGPGEAQDIAASSFHTLRQEVYH